MLDSGENGEYCSYSESMSKEPSSNSMGGGDALPLFRTGGAVLPGNFKSYLSGRISDEDELLEELESDWELESPPVTTHRLAGGFLASERREEWRHVVSGLSPLEAIFFTFLAAGAGAGITVPQLATRLRVRWSRTGLGA